MIAHLWQSTLLAGVVWLMTVGLRGNRAQVRCWLWKAASLKFLLPFSVLVAFGAQFHWRTDTPISQPVVALIIKQVVTPSVINAAPPVATQSALVWPLVLAFVWFVGFTVVLFWWWRGWSRVQSAVRNARPVELGASYDTAGLTVM